MVKNGMAISLRLLKKIAERRLRVCITGINYEEKTIACRKLEDAYYCP